MQGARLLKTATGAALGVFAQEMIQRGAEWMAGDIAGCIVAASVGTFAGTRAAMQPLKDARVYTDKEGGKVTVRQVQALRAELEWLRAPPALATFDRDSIPADNVMAIDIEKRNPLDWTFARRGWSEFDNAARPTEIANRSVREMAMDSYNRAACVPGLHLEYIERYVPGAGWLRYWRGMQSDGNVLWLGTVIDRRSIFRSGHMAEVEVA